MITQYPCLWIAKMYMDFAGDDLATEYERLIFTKILQLWERMRGD